MSNYNFGSPFIENILLREINQRRDSYDALKGYVSPYLAERATQIAQTYPNLSGGIVTGLALSDTDPSDPSVMDLALLAAQAQTQNSDALRGTDTQLGYTVPAEAGKDNPLKAAVRNLFLGWDMLWQEALQRPLRAAVKNYQEGRPWYEVAFSPFFPNAPGYKESGISDAAFAIEARKQGQKVNLGTGFFPKSTLAPETERALSQGADIITASANPAQQALGAPITHITDAKRQQVQIKAGPTSNETYAVTPGRLIASQFVNESDSQRNWISGLLDFGANIALDPANVLTGGIANARKANRVLQGAAGQTKRGWGFLAQETTDYFQSPLGQKIIGDLAENTDFMRTHDILRHTQKGTPPGTGQLASYLTKETDPQAIQRALMAFGTGEGKSNFLRYTLGPQSLLGRMTGRGGAPISEAIGTAIAGGNRAVGRQGAKFSLAYQLKGTLLGRWAAQGGAKFIDINNADNAITELAEWMKIAKFDPERISHYMGRLADATDGRYETSFAVVTDMVGELSERLIASGLPEAPVRKFQNIFNDMEEMRNYWRNAANQPQFFPGARFQFLKNGEIQYVDSAHLWQEFLHRAIPLPDIRHVRKAIRRAGINDISDRFGRVINRNIDGWEDFGPGVTEMIADTYMQKVWKPLVLLRVAWPVRVVGEEQIRMAAAGMTSMVSHPIQAIAWTFSKKAGASDILGNAIDMAGDYQAAMTRSGIHNLIEATGYRRPTMDEWLSAKWGDPRYEEGLLNHIRQLHNDELARATAGGTVTPYKVPMADLTSFHHPYLDPLLPRKQRVEYLNSLGPDDEIWVFHSTARADADALASGGWQPLDYEKMSTGAEWGPTKALYVSTDYRKINIRYGEGELVAMRVRKGDLASPPEAEKARFWQNTDDPKLGAAIADASDGAAIRVPQSVDRVIRIDPLDLIGQPDPLTVLKRAAYRTKGGRTETNLDDLLELYDDLVFVTDSGAAASAVESGRIRPSGQLIEGQNIDEYLQDPARVAASPPGTTRMYQATTPDGEVLFTEHPREAWALEQWGDLENVPETLYSGQLGDEYQEWLKQTKFVDVDSQKLSEGLYDVSDLGDGTWTLPDHLRRAARSLGSETGGASGFAYRKSQLPEYLQERLAQGNFEVTTADDLGNPVAMIAGDTRQGWRSKGLEPVEADRLGPQELREAFWEGQFSKQRNQMAIEGGSKELLYERWAADGYVASIDARIAQMTGGQWYGFDPVEFQWYDMFGNKVRKDDMEKILGERMKNYDAHQEWLPEDSMQLQGLLGDAGPGPTSNPSKALSGLNMGEYMLDDYADIGQLLDDIGDPYALRQQIINASGPASGMAARRKAANDLVEAFETIDNLMTKGELPDDEAFRKLSDALENAEEWIPSNAAQSPTKAGVASDKFGPDPNMAQERPVAVELGRLRKLFTDPITGEMDTKAFAKVRASMGPLAPQQPIPVDWEDGVYVLGRPHVARHDKYGSTAMFPEEIGAREMAGIYEPIFPETPQAGLKDSELGKFLGTTRQGGGLWVAPGEEFGRLVPDNVLIVRNGNITAHMQFDLHLNPGAREGFRTIRQITRLAGPGAGDTEGLTDVYRMFNELTGRGLITGDDIMLMAMGNTTVMEAAKASVKYVTKGANEPRNWQEALDAIQQAGGAVGAFRMPMVEQAFTEQGAELLGGVIKTMTRRGGKGKTPLAAENIPHHRMQYIVTDPGMPELRKLITEGTFDDGLDITNPKNYKEAYKRISELTRDGAGPQFVKVAKEAPVTLGSTWDKAVDHAFGWLMSKPSNYLSRSPAFKQFYWKRVGELLPYASDEVQAAILQNAAEAGIGRDSILGWIRRLATDEKGLTDEDVLKGLEKLMDPGFSPRASGAARANSIDDIDWFDDISKAFALTETKRLLYDLSKRSNFFDMTRIIFPFGEAWWEIISTWGRIMAENPQALRRVQQTVEGARNSGVFYTDEQTGEEVFNYPGSDLMNKWLFKDEPQGEDAGTARPQMTGRVLGLNLMLGSYIPGVGPVLQIPASSFEFLKEPNWKWAKELILPFGSVDVESPGDVLDATMPAWFRKAMTGFLGTPTGDDKRLYENTVMDVLRAGLLNGEYSDETPEQYSASMESAKTRARDIYRFRAAAQFIGPTGASVRWDARDKDGKVWAFQALSTEYRVILEANDFNHTQAFKEFTELFGLDPSGLYTAKTRTIRRRSVTEAGSEWEAANKDIFAEYPLTAYYARPDDPDAPFDYNAYLKQLDEGSRVALTADEWWLERNDFVGRLAYEKARRQVELLPSNDATDMWLRELKFQLMDRYPGYNVPLVGLERQADRDQIIRELEKWPQSEALMATEAGQGLADYLAARSWAKVESVGRGYTELGFRSAKGTSFLRDWLRTIATTTVQKYPAFGVLWDQVLSSELEDDDATGLSLLGVDFG